LRRDALHKATTKLAQQHQVVVAETLNATRMRTAGGACKKGLNRALADAALAQVRRMLGYKTRWHGSALVRGRPILSLIEDVLGVSQAKAKPDPRRPDLRV
jgi:putative transposase